MTDFGCYVRADGAYGVYETTNGIDRHPIPTATYRTPREAVRYAEMRSLHVPASRRAVDDTGSLPVLPRQLDEAPRRRLRLSDGHPPARR